MTWSSDAGGGTVRKTLTLSRSDSPGRAATQQPRQRIQRPPRATGLTPLDGEESQQSKTPVGVIRAEGVGPEGKESGQSESRRVGV